MGKSFVYNKSRMMAESAIKSRCPRCKGFGAIFPADFANGGKEYCYLCGGKGELWISESGSGWTRPIGGKSDQSSLY